MNSIFNENVYGKNTEICMQNFKSIGKQNLKIINFNEVNKNERKVNLITEIVMQHFKSN